MRGVRVFQDRFGFTRNEVRAILLLSGTLVLGSTVKMLRTQDVVPVPEFDYSRHDSEFTALSQRMVQSSFSDTDTARSRTRSRQETPLAPAGINLNTATKEDLMRLPGIGQAYAERILEYRKKVNQFRSIDELDQVKGIGKRRLEKIRPFVRIERD